MRTSNLLVALSIVPALAACGQPAAPCGPAGSSGGASSSGSEAPAPVVVYARTPSTTPPIQGQPALPQPSPRAAVEQTVGVADLRLDYSSPGARGRTIWGELVPYGEIWRAGANAPTRLELSEPSTIFGASVPAGAYTLLVIPGEAEWTVILNRDPSGQGYNAHDPAHDVARGTVQPADAPPRERLTYTFEDTTESSTTLVLDWAGKRVSIPISFDTGALVAARIEGVLGQAWRPHFNAGRYYLDQGDAARALEMLQRSQQIQATWWNEWWLARALAALERREEARAHAEAAQRLGAGDQVFERNFAAQVQSALEEWR